MTFQCGKVLGLGFRLTVWGFGFRPCFRLIALGMLCPFMGKSYRRKVESERRLGFIRGFMWILANMMIQGTF